MVLIVAAADPRRHRHQGGDAADKVRVVAPDAALPAARARRGSARAEQRRPAATQVWYYRSTCLHQVRCFYPPRLLGPGTQTRLRHVLPERATLARGQGTIYKPAAFRSGRRVVFPSQKPSVAHVCVWGVLVETSPHVGKMSGDFENWG